MRRFFALALVLSTALAGCAEKPPGDGGPPPVLGEGDAGSLDALPAGDYTATIETSKGMIVVELWEDKAPLHVANFLQYAEQAHYDGTIFHRVVKDFVIQGGGFSAPFSATSQPRETLAPIPVEVWPGSTHDEGTLGMARTQDPDSATSQWFISTQRNTNLDSGYTAFGKVTSGIEVVRAIEAVAVGSRGQHQNVPVDDVTITKVTVATPGGGARPSAAAPAGSYGVASGGKVSVPVIVRNVGGARAAATLAATGDGVSVSVLREPGDLSAGYTGVGIVEFAAGAGFQGGEATITASLGGGTDTVRIVLRPVTSTDVAGAANPKVSMRYVGLYDNGVVFDTTSTDLDDRGFDMASRWREHAEALKVWVGDGETADQDYTPVIAGFKAGVLGLKEGETRTVRLSPEEGYQDGRWRVFEMSVVSID